MEDYLHVEQSWSQVGIAIITSPVTEDFRRKDIHLRTQIEIDNVTL